MSHKREAMSGLQVTALSIRFGGIVALDNVSFSVAPRTIMGLIGPNGAGKTTVFNCISRFYDPSSGTITFDDADLLPRRPHDIVRLGIGRTFQNLELFPTMSVVDNLLVGQHTRATGDLFSAAFRLPHVVREERRMRVRAREALDFLGLGAFENRIVGSLAFGVRKRVDFARALVAGPKLLLLDEPAAGLSHEDMDDLGLLIRRMRDEAGAAVLLVEHHMSLVMAVSDRVTVLDFGKKIAEGTPEEVRRNPAVIEAYLGEPAEEHLSSDATAADSAQGEAARVSAEETPSA